MGDAVIFLLTKSRKTVDQFLLLGVLAVDHEIETQPADPSPLSVRICKVEKERSDSLPGE